MFNEIRSQYGNSIPTEQDKDSRVNFVKMFGRMANDSQAMKSLLTEWVYKNDSILPSKEV